MRQNTIDHAVSDMMTRINALSDRDRGGLRAFISMRAENDHDFESRLLSGLTPGDYKDITKWIDDTSKESLKRSR